MAELKVELGPDISDKSLNKTQIIGARLDFTAIESDNHLQPPVPPTISYSSHSETYYSHQFRVEVKFWISLLPALLRNNRIVKTFSKICSEQHFSSSCSYIYFQAVSNKTTSISKKLFNCKLSLYCPDEGDIRSRRRFWNLPERKDKNHKKLQSVQSVYLNWLEHVHKWEILLAENLLGDLVMLDYVN
jgi:hypothetical protein